MMRIKKSTLDKIIKEEVKSTLKEVYYSEKGSTGELSASELLQFGNEFAKLDGATRYDMEVILDLGDEGEANPNRIQKALDMIGGWNEELDQALSSYLSTHHPAWGGTKKKTK